MGIRHREPLASVEAMLEKRKDEVKVLRFLSMAVKENWERSDRSSPKYSGGCFDLEDVRKMFGDGYCSEVAADLYRSCQFWLEPSRAIKGIGKRLTLERLKKRYL